MLAAWGMHRMGPMGAKLSNFEIISSNFARQVDAVKKHETKKLAEVSAEELPAITGTLWNIISGLKISASQTQIVAGSKALHHIVPDLVPPIDREYTIQFVYGYKRNTPSQAEFARILATFHTVANSLGQHLEDIVRTCRDDRSQMDTSATKLIDNAIVGYALLHPYAVQPPTDPK